MQKGRCRASSWESRAEELFFIGMGLRQVVGGEVDRIEIEIEKVGAVGEVKAKDTRHPHLSPTWRMNEWVSAMGCHDDGGRMKMIT